jgi:drug/metabolite transporter (DMT)-like permease
MSGIAKALDAQEWSLLIFLSVLWGGAFFFAGVAVRELPPLTVVLVRVGLAAAVLTPLFWYFGHSFPKKASDWLPFLGMGFFNNVLPFGFIFAGQTQITVGLSSIINALTPLFTVLVMAIFHEERLTIYRLVGVLLGVVGVALLHGLEVPVRGDETFGIALCMAGAISYAFAALWARRRLVGVPPLKSATCQLICSTLVMAVVVAVFDQPWSLDPPSLTTILSILALAIFGTALAYIVFFQIVVSAGAGNVMLVTLLIPVTALVLGNVFLKEPIQSREIIGATVIGIGLLFIDGRLVDAVAGRRGRDSCSPR